MSENLHPAYLISSIPYRETSVIGNFFVLDYGLVSLVVKGVRVAKPKVFLQPFTPLLINFYGKGDLKTCKKIELASQPIWLKGKALACGWYMNELLARLLPQQTPIENLFQIYARFMPSLQDDSKILESLREFELHLLKSLGINPYFITADGQQILPDKIYTYVDNCGFVIADDQLTNMSFRGEQLLDIKNSNWNKAALTACRRLTNHFITPLLGNKPLQSKKLLITGG